MSAASWEHRWVPPVAALLVAAAAGELLAIGAGASPLAVLEALVAGTWGNAYGLGQVWFKATPLLFTGLAVAIPFRAGLFNVGAEGQAIVGALAVGVVGRYLPAGTPAIVAVPVCVAAGAGAGAALGALPGWLRARFGAHEVIASIMLNFVAAALANWAVASFLAEPETLHTAAIVPGASLSRLSAWSSALTGSAVNTSLFLGIAVLVAGHHLLTRTPLGLSLRAVGLGPRAAEAGGLPVGRLQVLAMALGGALAGLVGVNAVQGHKGYYEDGFSGGVGFLGIAVAMLARAEPLLVLPAALLFATLSEGGLAIRALVPKELVDVLVGVVILAVVGAQGARARAAR